MQNRRGPLAALALLAATGITLSGCGIVGAAGRSAAAPAAPDPKVALAQSTDQLAKGNYAFSISGGGDRQEGEVHLPESALLQMWGDSEGPEKVDFLLVGKDRYMKLKADLGTDMPSDKELEALIKRGGRTAKAARQVKEVKVMFDGEHWLHVDPAKLDKEGAEMFSGFTEPDVTGVSVLATKAATAVRQGNTITGTLDVSGMKADELPWDDDEIKKMGAKLKALPFSASLDTQGRLVRFVIDIPAVDKAAAYKHVTEVSAYGATKTQPRPRSGEVVEMSDEMYKSFQDK